MADTKSDNQALRNSLGLWCERLYPFILGSLAPIVVWYLRRNRFSPSYDQIKDILDGSIGLGGVVVGFLATALAILFAVQGGPAVRFMRRSGGMKLLVSYLEVAVVMWLGATLYALLFMFFMPDVKRMGLTYEVSLGWSYFFGVAILVFYRASRTTGRFLRRLVNESSD